jgi:hypothetical protein
MEEVFLKINAEFAEENKQDAMPTDIALNANGNTGETATLLDSQRVDEEIDGSGPPAEHEGSLIRHSGVGQNVGALLTKRYQIYKRDRMGLCCEVFCPVILVLVGCGLAKIQFLHDTAAVNIQPDAYPYQQRILMNDEAMVDAGSAGAVTPQTLA